MGTLYPESHRVLLLNKQLFQTCRIIAFPDIAIAAKARSDDESIVLQVIKSLVSCDDQKKIARHCYIKMRWLCLILAERNYIPASRNYYSTSRNYIPTSRNKVLQLFLTKAYLENFKIDEKDDWLSCFEVGRDEDGNPKYGLVAPLFLDIEDEMERTLAMKAYFNPFKNIIVFKKLIGFLGSLSVQLKNTDWGNEGYGMYKKIEGDGHGTPSSRVGAAGCVVMRASFSASQISFRSRRKCMSATSAIRRSTSTELRGCLLSDMFLQVARSKEEYGQVSIRCGLRGEVGVSKVQDECSNSELDSKVSNPRPLRAPKWMENMQSYWQLGDELRGQSKVSEDQKWYAAASRLAEQTRSKGERRNNLDLSKVAVDVRPRENVGFQEENKFESLNFNMLNLNLDMKMTENMNKNSLRNSVFNMNAMYQKGNNRVMENMVSGKYPGMSHNKDVNVSSNHNSNNNDSNNNNAADKRFKTLPAAETLPRDEVLGGYIFVCNNDTMQEDLKRQLFGLPPRYRDSVRAITPGLPLFLYNYTTHQLHGIFEATTFGGSNIDATAWEDKKCKGESRFPAQVRIRIRKVCKALEEDAFRPVLHHYDGPKFRLELSIPETLDLLDLCEQNGV
ncbi:B2 protein [Tanacetum coccineum]